MSDPIQPLELGNITFDGELGIAKSMYVMFDLQDTPGCASFVVSTLNKKQAAQLILHLLAVFDMDEV